jgi:hypothetical protein
MVKAMNAKITFTGAAGQTILRQPNSVRVESSWRALTDKAEITLPRNIKVFDKQKVRDVFKRGDKVLIELGYNGFFNKEFEGYITKVSDDYPIVIECEDEMFKLKSEKVHIVTKGKTQLEAFIKDITASKIKAVANYELGPLRFANTTTAKVLEYLQNELNLYSYFDNGELVVAEIYGDNTNDAIQVIDLDHVVNNSLAYEERSLNKIKVTAVSTLSDGSKIEVSVGDDDGTEQRTSHYNITDQATLKKLAQEDLRKFKTNRYTGTFSHYADLVVRHGQKVDVRSEIYPERNGVYYVDKTIVNFDFSPQYRREIGLDEQVAA